VPVDNRGMSFYIQLATAVLVLVSLVAHKLHHDKIGDLADKLEKQIGDGK
jgi:hypothetical protein